MKDSELTKQLIIEKSALIFNKQGYAGTTVSDLTKSFKLTKGSLYWNFKNKNEVAIEAFKYNFRVLTERIMVYVSKEATSVGKLLAMTRFYRENVEWLKKIGGCPLMNAATDSDDTNDQLRSEVAKAFEGAMSVMVGAIEMGKKNKEISGKINAKKYSALLFSLVEGGILLSKTTNNNQYLLDALDRADKIVHDEIKL